MAYIVPIASVIAFQSDPTKLVGTFSVVGNMNSSITAFQGGAWTTSLVSTVPSSVVVGASIQGTVPVTQTTSPWIINMPSPSVVVIHPAGSVVQVRMDNASVIAVLSNSSVATLQGTTPWITQIIGSVALGVGNTSVTQSGAWNVNVNSILGTYQEKNATVASAIGIPFLFKNNMTTSTLSTVSITDPLPVQGSVMVLQGTNPWQVNLSSPSIIILTPAGSVQAVRTDNASVIAVLSNSSVTALQGTNPWIVNVPTPSYIAYQLAGSVMAVNTTVTTGPSSVQLLSTSASIVTVQNYGYASVMLMASTSASVVTLVTNQLQGVSSVQLMSTSASIAVAQATNPWVIGSIVGTYQEDQGATTSDKGLFVLHVRNDTMSSVTNADLDYSALSVGPVGEMITANSPITKWFSQTASVMYGTSVQVVAPPGASIFSYITGIHVMNESANFSRVTISQGLGAVAASILTRVPGPATGGSNSNYINGIRVLDNNGISASISGVSSVLVTITGFTSKT